ncbi:MAG: hypothetical protein ACO3YZ_06910 [Candidatus Nanopelagicaceae bacterium]
MKAIIFTTSREHSKYKADIKAVFPKITELHTGDYCATFPDDQLFFLLEKLEDILLKKLGKKFHGFLVSDFVEGRFLLEIYDGWRN